MTNTVPCTNPAHGVRNHLAGSEAAARCSFSARVNSASLPATGFVPSASAQAQKHDLDISSDVAPYLKSASITGEDVLVTTASGEEHRLRLELAFDSTLVYGDEGFTSAVGGDEGADAVTTFLEDEAKRLFPFEEDEE